MRAPHTRLYVSLMTPKSDTAANRTDANGSTETFRIPLEAAELYEAKFVPAVFAEWAPVIIDAVAAKPSDRLLDVACGTGIVARTARQLLGPETAITGIDLNEAMLRVAASAEPSIDWRQGDVAEMPFDDASFDVACCQMAFMFFPDRHLALTEMSRVVRPGGRVAVVVPASLDAQPAYAPFVEISASHVGPEARSLLGTYWNCGDLPAFVSDMEAAGFADVVTRTRAGTAHFESVADFVDTEIDGSPLAERVTDEQRRAIVGELAPRLGEYGANGEGRAADEALTIPLVCHVLAASAA